jgi:hypothetical protein
MLKIVLGISIIIIFGSPFLVYFLDKTSCIKTSKAIGYTCEYSFYTGCIIHTKDGKKVLLEQIRNIGENK